MSGKTTQRKENERKLQILLTEEEIWSVRRSIARYSDVLMKLRDEMDDDIKWATELLEMLSDAVESARMGDNT